MVGFGVWGEYFSKLLERDFEKGGCGNVVSKLIVAVVSHNGRDHNGRDTIHVKTRLCTRVPAGHLGRSSAKNHNQDKLQTKIETSWFLKRVRLVSACP